MRGDIRLENRYRPGLMFYFGLFIGALLLTGILLPLFLDSGSNRVQAVSLPEMVSAIEVNNVEKLIVRGDRITAITSRGPSLITRKESNISAIEALQHFGVSAEALRNLSLVVIEPGPDFAALLNVLAVVTPFLLIILFVGWHMQRGKFSTLPGPFDHSNTRVRPRFAGQNAQIQRPRVTFRDVAGLEEAKLDLREMVEFLKEPDRFLRLGARVPKGVLMAGAPGTGKTLLAKAVAGEAGVPFFYVSGSEFVEMYVGVGAARVRDLFKRAKERPPAVIFVDEIDAVGRKRGAGLGGGNDEREQTLNQILVEMDGFDTDTHVIVIAATNRPDVLDTALLRPGRFDRKVILDRPDVRAREAILKIHSRGKPLTPDVSLSDLAKLTPGFVGADLENVVNEAAILAARRNLTEISVSEFQDAIERIVAGPERKSNLMAAEERRVIAYHEAGHAVVMHHVQEGDPVHKVSIVARGMALGYTMPLPENEKMLRSKKAFESELVGLLGGRAAEEIIFERATTGAANDLERATKLARAMVTRYGFGEGLGLRTFGEEQGNPFLGNLGEIRNYSEETARRIDREIEHILHGAYHQAKEILVKQRAKLECLAEALLEFETIDRPQFETMMG